MRDMKYMFRDFVPLNEIEWQSRKFIDGAIKSKIELQLEVIARALSGSQKIKIRYSDDPMFKRIDHIKADNGKWFEVTKNYKWEVSFGRHSLCGINKIDMWLKVIEFWAANERLYPCGGASHPSTSQKEEDEL